MMMTVHPEDVEAIRQVVGEIFMQVYMSSPMAAEPILQASVDAQPSGSGVAVTVAFSTSSGAHQVKVTVPQPERIFQSPRAVLDELVPQFTRQLTSLAAGKKGTEEPKVDPTEEARNLAAAEEAQRKVEQAEREERSGIVAASAKYTIDDLGAVVLAPARLSEVEVLSKYVVQSLDGDVPPGLEPQLAEELQGKRIDVVVRVQHLSEVFIDGLPASGKALELGEPLDLDGFPTQVLKVQAPRLASGTLVLAGDTKVFTSRKPKELPKNLLKEILT